MGASRCRRCRFEPVGLQADRPRPRPASSGIKYTLRDVFSREVVIGVALGLVLFPGIIIILAVLLLSSNSGW